MMLPDEKPEGFEPVLVYTPSGWAIGTLRNDNPFVVYSEYWAMDMFAVLDPKQFPRWERLPPHPKG